MTSHGGETGAVPADNANPSWKWLQSRFEASGKAMQFAEWVEGQLATLEDEYSELITVRSRNRSLRDDFQDERSS